MSRSSYVLNATCLDRSRSSWNQSKSHKFSMPFGKVIPLGAPIDVLPGDTWKSQIGSIIRMLTPKSPLMDRISGDVYAYFVPYRLIFDKTKQFFGQNETEAWTLNLQYNLPHVKVKLYQANYTKVYDYYYLNGNPSTSLEGTLLDHFELPFVRLVKDQYDTLPASNPSDANLSFQAMPFRAYQMIWNEDFRNPSVVDPELFWKYDHTDVTSYNLAGLDYVGGIKLLPVMRYRDLYSSALKSPQRGPSAVIPLGSTARLKADHQLMYDLGNPINFGIVDGDDDPTTNVGQFGSDEATIDTNSSLSLSSDGSGNTGIDATNLLVDLSKASSATIQALRNSIAVQHLYEMMTNAFRYQEYTNVFFGVRGSDATLQRPQFLGGIHFNWNIHQVIQTTESINGDLGKTGAFGLAEFGGHLFTQSFTEHGLIMYLIVSRKEHTYCQGLDKYWRKREFLDVFQPPLQHIGNVDIKSSEIFFAMNANGTSLDDLAFGYSEPYYEYRYTTSKAVGLMSPLAKGSLSFYSLTDVLSEKPYLNSTFVSEDANGLDNALIASVNNVVDQFYGEVFFKWTCTRVMDLYDVPGLTRI